MKMMFISGELGRNNTVQGSHLNQDKYTPGTNPELTLDDPDPFLPRMSGLVSPYPLDGRVSNLKASRAKRCPAVSSPRKLKRSETKNSNVPQHEMMG